jgi:hypothetical protein
LILDTGQSAEYTLPDNNIFGPTINYNDSFQTAYIDSKLNEKRYNFDLSDDFGQFYVAYNVNTSSDNDPDFAGYAIYAIKARPFTDPVVDGFPVEFVGILPSGPLKFVVSREMIEEMVLEGGSGNPGIIIIKPLDVFDTEVAREFTTILKIPELVDIRNCVQIEITNWLP